LNVHYVTALGTDNFSEEMLAAWQQEQIHTDLIQRMDNKLPGLYFIETDSTGERTFYYWRNDAAARFWLTSPAADEICQRLEKFDYLYLSGISLAILDSASRQRLLQLLRACRANGGKVIFDNNYRPRLWQSKQETQEAYRAMLACTDIAFLTLDDEDMLWGEKPLEQVIDRTQALGVSEIIIKRGADSCIVWEKDGFEAHQYDVPAVKLPKDKVVDTTAAGDSFSAGYLAVRLIGGSAHDAAVRGHLTASTVIQYRGAIIPLAAMPAV
jgi:2-dehydro-3-deoxygluconokinase